MMAACPKCIAEFDELGPELKPLMGHMGRCPFHDKPGEKPDKNKYLGIPVDMSKPPFSLADQWDHQTPERDKHG